MKTIYNGSDATIILYWKIWRGENKTTEDLSNLNRHVFLVGSCNTYSVVPDIVTDEELGNKVLKAEIDASILRTGIYDVKAVWEKNDGRNIMKSARTSIFAITDNVEEVGEVKSEEVIRIVSHVESIGRDGLSAYEIAVIRGLNNGLSENDWVGNEAGRIEAEIERDKAEDIREDNERARQAAETDRWSTFNTFMRDSATVFDQAQDARDSDFNTAQEDRESAFDVSQSNREKAFASKIKDFENRFNEAEANRDDGEERRNADYERAEQERNVKYNTAEATRNSTINDKLGDIDKRYKTAEAARADIFNAAESKRQENEEYRIQAEGKRQSDFEENEQRREQTFQDNEVEREKNEVEREKNEAVRNTQEGVRQQAEQIRIETFDENERGRIATFNANEAARIAAENERKQNEAERETNEAIRQESYQDKLPVSAVVQETGDGENVVMSQKAVSGKIAVPTLIIGAKKEVKKLIAKQSSNNTPFYLIPGTYTFNAQIAEVFSDTIYITCLDSDGNTLLDTGIMVGYTDLSIALSIKKEGWVNVNITRWDSVDQTIEVHVSLLMKNNHSELLEGLQKSVTNLDALYTINKTYDNAPIINIIKGKFIEISGAVGSHSNSEISDYVEYIPTMRYTYQGVYQYLVSPITYYDKNKNIIGSYSNESAPEPITATIILEDVPIGTKYLRFSSYNGPLSVTIESLSEFIDTIKSDVEKLTPTFREETVEPLSGKYLDSEGDELSYAAGYYSDYYAINPNSEKISYRGKTRFAAKMLIFYNSNKSVISTYPAQYIEDEETLSTNDVLIPTDARYVRFGSLGSSFTATIYDNSIVAAAIKNVTYSPLYNKSVIWVGDSITEGSVRLTPHHGGWASIISKKNKMSSTNYGIGGTCITKIEGKSDSIVERLQTYSKNVDYCIVQGGLNDIVQAEGHFGEITDGYEKTLDITTYCGAWEYICKYLITEYSTKKFGIIINYTIANDTWNDLANKVVLICEKWGVPYIDLRKCAGFNLYNTDCRRIYGTYVGDIEEYDENLGYSLDEITKYQSELYKATEVITAPAGEFDFSKWMKYDSGVDSQYDPWHCNITGYEQLSPKIEKWMESL